MCECGKGHSVPDPTPWSVILAGFVELAGKMDGKGGFREKTVARVVRWVIAWLRSFAMARINSSEVVRIRPWDDREAVSDAACEAVCWLDAIGSVQALAGE